MRQTMLLFPPNQTNTHPGKFPRIISPKTNKPAVEDLMKKSDLSKLVRMLHNDKRLDEDTKLRVIFAVCKRQNEMEQGSTLGDITGEEVRKVLEKKD